jgi:hypothetical protein
MHFKVQTHHSNKNFLVTVPDSAPCHFYLFDEFDIWQHIGMDNTVNFKISSFNLMMSCKSSSVAEYDALASNYNSWPGPNVKGKSNIRTHPFVVFIFFTNVPLSNPGAGFGEYDNKCYTQFLNRFSLKLEYVLAYVLK